MILGVAEGVGGVDYTGELFVLGGILLTGLLGLVSALVVKKLREPTRIETLWGRLDVQDEKIAALNDRVETAERRAGAAGRVIRDLARQWPEQHTPRLNPVDLDELDETTIPTNHPWRAKP